MGSYQLVVNYFAAAVVFSALALVVHLADEWWYRHLMRIAETHELESRRALAARQGRFLVLALAVLILVALYGIFRLVAVDPLFILGGVAAAIAPNLLWWLWRWPALRALGYGRRQQQA